MCSIKDTQSVRKHVVQLKPCSNDLQLSRTWPSDYLAFK